MKVTDLAFREGQELKVRVCCQGDCCSFAINIGIDPENIALHFNPRFDSGGDTNTIVCNSKSGNCWGDEQRSMDFPFCKGEECKFYINFNMERFYIKLPDGSMIDFPNRLGEVRYDYFSATGEAQIVGIKKK